MVSDPQNPNRRHRSTMSTRSLFLGVPLALAIAGGAAAQEARAYRVEPGGRTYSFSTSSDDGDRAVIGISTGSGSARDTLGVLVSSVTAGGPAEKAGIEEGSRIASINGVNLKLAAVDVGDWDMSGQMTRRFTREMGKLKAGDEVELKVYSGGQTKTVKVKTVMYDDLYRITRNSSRTRSDDEDRAALGVSLGSYGSKRDTLGVLLSRVEDNGPAGKAGLEEGNRIQSINGVDLRVGKEDAGDESVSSSKVRRLQREMEKVKAGDEVTLKVYTGGGRTRDLKVKTVPMSDLPRSGFTIFGTTPMTMPMPARPPMELNGLRRMLDETGVRQNLLQDQTRQRIEDQVRTRIQQIEPTIRRAVTVNRVIL
jgi:predicted metalloprotease with PDZ domain